LSNVAVAIVCKAPEPGRSKTRQSPPLRPEECAAISACFIQDLAATIGALAADGDVTGYALYTPRGSEPALRRLLPERFDLAPQCDGDFGMRLIQGTRDLLNAGHRGVILVNSDSPTLPRPILRAAVDATRRNDGVVLGPAFDGGYTLIGLSKPHDRLFEDIPWSTGAVYALTLERAQELGLSVHSVPGWYDVDDEESLQMLEQEFSGRPPGFSAMAGADAPMTRGFLKARAASLAEHAAVAP
jgi:rSAM/selenodomain-associated transferase 1